MNCGNILQNNDYANLWLMMEYGINVLSEHSRKNQAETFLEPFKQHANASWYRRGLKGLYDSYKMAHFIRQIAYLE